MVPLPADLTSLLVRTRRYLGRLTATAVPDDDLLLASVGPPASGAVDGVPVEVADVLAVADGFSLGGVMLFGAGRSGLSVADALAILPEPPSGGWYLLGRTWDEDNLLLSLDDGHVRATAGTPGAALAGHDGYHQRFADGVEHLLRTQVFGAGAPDDDAPGWRTLLGRLDVVEPRREWVRFEAAEPGRRGRHAGVFALANGLAHSGRLSEEDFAWWRRSNDAMNAAYAHPPAGAYDAAGHLAAASWFRADAGGLLEAARGYLDLLTRYGVAWRERRTDDPGRVVHEDDVQVVAQPW